MFVNIDEHAGSDLILYCTTSEGNLGVLAIQSKSGEMGISNSIKTVTPGFQYTRKDGVESAKRLAFIKLMRSRKAQEAQKHWMRIVWSSNKTFHVNLVKKLNFANRTDAETQPILLLETNDKLGLPNTKKKMVGKKIIPISDTNEIKAD